MRLSMEDSTDVPLLLTDLVKVVKPGARTPVEGIMASCSNLTAVQSDLHPDQKFKLGSW